jgi:RNA polymerase sigma-70 factor (ECF subfamily)
VTIAEQNIRFENWLVQHGAILHHVANGFAEGADRQDLMQELLLALWRAVPAFGGAAQASTFVYRVAHNTALTWERTQRNYGRRVAQFEAMQTPFPLERDGPAREQEALEYIYAAIRQLPPVDRSLILLQLDGVSYAEIAALHGLSETNVGVRLTRLKQKLTTALANISHELR